MSTGWRMLLAFVGLMIHGAGSHLDLWYVRMLGSACVFVAVILVADTQARRVG